jgi:hypothetical protein
MRWGILLSKEVAMTYICREGDRPDVVIEGDCMVQDVENKQFAIYSGEEVIHTVKFGKRVRVLSLIGFVPIHSI